MFNLRNGPNTKRTYPMFQIRLFSLATDRPSNNADYRIMQRKCGLAFDLRPD
jgi:hypothetical protein